jgi:O-6-methylguanine DNA methyltransferase
LQAKKQSSNPCSFSCFNSVIGTIFVISTPRGVSNIIFGNYNFGRFLDTLNGTRPVEGGQSEHAAGEVRLYLEGKIRDFKSKLDLSFGTPFQISVWNEILKIPYGSVNTYREIAERIGTPFAARAVGNAVGANPIPIVIPCHRVIGVNGLGGYSSGIEIKKKLLQIEGALP